MCLSHAHTHISASIHSHLVFLGLRCSCVRACVRVLLIVSERVLDYRSTCVSAANSSDTVALAKPSAAAAAVVAAEHSEQTTHTPSTTTAATTTTEESVVEAFALDPDFDYEDMRLTDERPLHVTLRQRAMEAASGGDGR